MKVFVLPQTGWNYEHLKIWNRILAKLRSEYINVEASHMKNELGWVDRQLLPKKLLRFRDFWEELISELQKA